MIVREFYETRADGVNLYCTYSDAHKRIRQEETGAVYDEAIDVESATYTYTETTDDVEVMEAQDALDFIFGGTK